jgi:hypothetical protein
LWPMKGVQFDMQLYTVMCDFEGGTYIVQQSSTDPEAALRASLPALTLFLNQSIEKLAESVKDSDLVPIDGCKNVWATTGLLNEALLLVHVVATVGG